MQRQRMHSRNRQWKKAKIMNEEKANAGNIERKKEKWINR